MKDSVTIVLDPGHGGENHGLEYNGYLEKEMNLTVANAMKEELEKYDGVTVYLTNPECLDLSLEERAQYAKSVEADVMISLHFNMSENHQMFGSEVWIPSVGQNNAWMHTLGDLFIEELQTNGLHNRGVKTRLNGKGTDYYGILREATNLGIPSILVEHCYADAKEDAAYLEDTADLETFGVWDATAVAKFYGLTSTQLGRDYSTYVKNAYFIPEDVVRPDETAPEAVTLFYVMSETEHEEVNISSDAPREFLVTAKDGESVLCYYDYSLDGGENWSDLLAWSDGAETMRFTVEELPKDAKVLARVYNGHFLDSTSNTICFVAEEQKMQQKAVTEETAAEQSTAAIQRTQSLQRVLSKASLVCLVLALLLLFFTIMSRRKKQKRETLVGMVALISCIMLTTLLWGAQGSMKRQIQESSGQNIVWENQQNATEEVFSETILTCMNPESGVTEQEAVLLKEQSTAEVSEKELIYDIARGYLLVDSLPDMPRNSYDFSRITEQNGYKAYQDEQGNITSMLGVDVSKFQGNIDWQKVKDSGMEFAMLRLGLRGYGSGKLVMDDMFYVNLEGAKAAGLETGVYFFSAAISKEEAVEEAEYVAEALSGSEITMPVVFDTEPILYDLARTDGLSPQQLTDITRAFCDRIKELGYTPMIYANAKRLTTALYIEQLKDIPLWYADYQKEPLYPYTYEMWQYTEEGSVDGISGPVDIDLFFKM